VTVSIVLASGDTNFSVADGATLIFNASNWNLPQSVLIAAAEDNDKHKCPGSVRPVAPPDSLTKSQCD